MQLLYATLHPPETKPAWKFSYVHGLGVDWRVPWPGTCFLPFLRLFNPELEVCGLMFPGEVSKTDLLQHLERKCQQGWFHHPEPTALQELKAASVGSVWPLWPGGFWRDDPGDTGAPGWPGTLLGFGKLVVIWHSGVSCWGGGALLET